MQAPRPVELVVKDMQSASDDKKVVNQSNNKPKSDALKSIASLLEELVKVHLTLENDPASGFLSSAEGNIRHYLHHHSRQT